jgi:hypothetical protein
MFCAGEINCVVGHMAIEESLYMMSISNIQTSDYESFVLQVCLCRDNQPDCLYRPSVPTWASYERIISLNVAIVDSGKHIMNGSIEIIASREYFLVKVLSYQDAYGCTQLHFDMISFDPYQKLIVRPLTNQPGYRYKYIRIPIYFPSCVICPIGFVPSINQITGCNCGCDPNLEIEHIITSCNLSAETITKEGTLVWFSYVNFSENTSGYLIYPFCPQGYCYPSDTPVDINLNVPNGEDAQCAYNRSGVLCGGCRPGLSLSLGGSQCVQCPAHWSAILVVIIVGLFLGGIVLVALIMVLNLTIAVGTLNGLIFCANVINANSGSVQSVNSLGILGTFITWLNLNFGLNTCFYEGMDAYSKAWIELLFPAYIIFITVAIYFLSEYTTYFAKLVEKKNPIATLGTLVLLSYVRCLRTITSSYSFSILHYPDSSQVVWLPDGNVLFLKGKHIALFIMATIMLLVGLTYTIILFSWQWLLHFQQMAHKQIIIYVF